MDINLGVQSGIRSKSPATISSDEGEGKHACYSSPIPESTSNAQKCATSTSPFRISNLSPHRKRSSSTSPFTVSFPSPLRKRAASSSPFSVSNLSPQRKRANASSPLSGFNFIPQRSRAASNSPSSVSSFSPQRSRAASNSPSSVSSFSPQKKRAASNSPSSVSSFSPQKKRAASNSPSSISCFSPQIKRAASNSPSSISSFSPQKRRAASNSPLSISSYSPQRKRTSFVRDRKITDSNASLSLPSVQRKGTSSSPFTISDSSEYGSPIKKQKTVRRNITSKLSLKGFVSSGSGDSDTGYSKSADTVKRKLFEKPPEIKLEISQTSQRTDAHSTVDEPITRYREFSECLENNPLLPIYQPLNQGIKTKDAIHILLNTLSQNKLARTLPSYIDRNVSFVYSIEGVGHWQNPLCDNMGKWIQNGTSKLYIDPEEKTVINQNEISEDSLLMVRRIYVNGSNSSLHRVVITIETVATKEMLDYMFVQYFFTGARNDETKDTTLMPHGNSKQKKKPYKRTSESTIQLIKGLCKSNKNPTDIYHTIVERQGGLESVTAGQFLPADRQQIRNVKKTVSNPTDPLIECTDLAKEQEKMNKKFIRDVRSGPEFSMVLASDRQLQEVNKFCTQNKNFSVLGVDTTFNIGKYYVTVTTYRHLMLLTKNKVEPVMIGPILLHQKKTFESYFKLPSGMIQECPELKNLKVFGTDGEVSLSNAFEACFDKAHHLLCDIHMKDNIKSKLTSLHISGHTAEEYITEIFGRQENDLRHKGLVDCLTEEELSNKMEIIKPKWITRHENGKLFVFCFVLIVV